MKHAAISAAVRGADVAVAVAVAVAVVAAVADTNRTVVAAACAHTTTWFTCLIF